MPQKGLSAVRKGLEPSTSGVTGRHSNQLNYRTIYALVCVKRGCKDTYFSLNCKSILKIFAKFAFV